MATAVRPLSPERWFALHTRMDRVISEAAGGYLQELRRRNVPFDPLGWTRELSLLARGNIDFSRPGLPLMYAVRYMPRRMISNVAALTWALEDKEPAAILDVGSGTGAAIVAHQLLRPDSATQLLGVDASPEMVRFARHTQTGSRGLARFIAGSIADLIAEPHRLEPFDLVTFSAPFGADFSDWEPLAAAMDVDAAHGRTIVAIEPETRSSLLDSFEAALRSRGWSILRSGSDAIPAYMKEDRSLHGLTRFWRHLGRPGQYQPQTWWEPPADRFLLASRPQ